MWVMERGEDVACGGTALWCRGASVPGAPARRAPFSSVQNGEATGTTVSCTPTLREARFRTSRFLGFASPPRPSTLCVPACCFVSFRRVLSAPSPRRIGHLYLVTSRRWDAAKLSTIGTAARGIQDAHIGHRQNANSSNILKRCMVCIAPTASGGLPAAARERIARTGARLASSTRAARSGVLIFTAKVSHRQCFFARRPRRRPLSKA